MDYLISVFSKSSTNDGPIDYAKAKKAGFEANGDQYYRPWKWHWRQSDGPGWFEIGDRVHPVIGTDAALGKLTLRAWNRDPDRTTLPYAQIQISVLEDKTPQDINKIFSAYKYRDAHKRTNLKPFNDNEKDLTIQLVDVPGGTERNADYGDQRMRSWDVAELYFSASPKVGYKFKLCLWTKFGNPQPESRIFVKDPEMDVGFTIVAE